MTPLDNKGVVYITPNMHTTFTPHCDKAYTVGGAPNHHQLLKLYVSVTRRYIISSTYRLDPSHWTHPSVSEQDATITANHQSSCRILKVCP